MFGRSTYFAFYITTVSRFLFSHYKNNLATYLPLTYIVTTRANIHNSYSVINHFHHNPPPPWSKHHYRIAYHQLKFTHLHFNVSTNEIK